MALDLLEHVKPDLILLDIMMPGIDGLATYRTIKENPESGDIPIIFMTALSDTFSKLEGFKAGAVDYITKPLQYAEVVARIETHLSMRKMQLELQQMNHQLTLANQALSATNEELEAFARTVAHDLNNPVGVILGTSEMLEMKLVPPDQVQKSLRNITKTAYKMRNIISELLLLSRVRKTEVQLQVDCIIHKLNGQVGIESAPGQGSRFSFTLPAAN